MKIASIGDVKARLSSYVKSSEDGPVIITKNGKPVAVLISAIDEEELDRIVLAYTPKFRKLLDAARDRVKKTGGVTHTNFWTSVETGG